jgi:hypothetical protein
VNAGCAALAAGKHTQVLVQHIAGFYAMYFNKVTKTVSFGSRHTSHLTNMLFITCRSSAGESETLHPIPV